MTSVNINGESTLQSSVYSFLSCIEPSSLSEPQLVSLTSTSYQILWSLPSSEGGCPITSYKVYQDNGNNGPFTTLVASLSPSTLQVTKSGLSALTGLRIRVVV